VKQTVHRVRLASKLGLALLAFGLICLAYHAGHVRGSLRRASISALVLQAVDYDQLKVEVASAPLLRARESFESVVLDQNSWQNRLLKKIDQSYANAAIKIAEESLKLSKLRARTSFKPEQRLERLPKKISGS
jgi:hypothetical protein